MDLFYCDLNANAIGREIASNLADLTRRVSGSKTFVPCAVSEWSSLTRHENCKNRAKPDRNGYGPYGATRSPRKPAGATGKPNRGGVCPKSSPPGPSKPDIGPRRNALGLPLGIRHGAAPERPGGATQRVRGAPRTSRRVSLAPDCGSRPVSVRLPVLESRKLLDLVICGAFWRLQDRFPDVLTPWGASTVFFL